MEVEVRALDGTSAIATLFINVPIATSLGAAVDLFDQTAKAYLTPDGRSATVYFFKPTIDRTPRGLSLSIQISIDNLPHPGALISVGVATADYMNVVAWPEILTPAPTPKDAPAPQAESLAKNVSEVARPTPATESAPPTLQREQALLRPAATKTWLLQPGAIISVGSAVLLLAMLGVYLFYQFNTLTTERTLLDQRRSALSRDELSLSNDRKAYTAAVSSSAKEKNVTDQLAAQRRAKLDEDGKALELRKKFADDREVILDRQTRDLVATGQAIANERSRLTADIEAFERKRSETSGPPVAPAVSTITPAVVTPPVSISAASPSEDFVLACDRLAGNPTDQRRNKSVQGIGWAGMDVIASITACEKAVAATPGNQRVAYQLARATQKKDRDKARAMLQELVLTSSPYPAAFDNLAALVTDFNLARDLWRQGAAMGDPDAMYSLADMMFQDKLPETYSGEAFDLLQNAERLQSEPAKKTLAKLRTSTTFPNMMARWMNGAKIAIDTIKPFIRN